MKLKNNGSLPALLALAVISSILMLTACSGVAGSAAGGYASAHSAQNGPAAVEAAASSTSGADEAYAVTDAFSERDLEGDYDEEGAVQIDLTDLSGSDVTISEAGTYVLTGVLSNGSVVIDASSEDKIQLVLNGAEISSDTYAAIYVKQSDKVFVTLADGTENTLVNGGSFVQRDDNNVDGAVFSKDDLTINGTGSLTVVSPAGHGIVCKDELVMTGGTIAITAGEHAIQAKDSIAVSDGDVTIRAGEDGLHAENDEDDSLGTVYIKGGSISIEAGDDAIHAVYLLRVDGGELSLTAAEGLEATYVLINDGDITISASDDGINAARKSAALTPTVEINGGSLDITMGGGDTDAVDSNGNLVITGSTINITANSAFDFDGSVSFTGGSVTVNGRQLTEITGGMAGGFGGSGMTGGFGSSGGMGGFGGPRH